jgi:N-carbamoyl-L-amino-acid hydrolase
MPSGAGHDAMYVAHCGPSGMIFIPCLDGRSHSAVEWASPAQVLAGTRVLAATLQGLDRELD